MSINRKLLEKEVESKRRNVESYRNYIVPREDECISVLEAKKSEKEEELKNCYWMQCMIFFIVYLLSVDQNAIKIYFNT